MNVIALQESLQLISPLVIGVRTYPKKNSDGSYDHSQQPAVEVDYSDALSPEIKADIEAAIANWSDPIPQDWDGFVDALGADVMVAIAQSAMASLITSRMTRLADEGDTFKGSDDRLITAWNAAPPSLTEGQRDALAGHAATYGIPLAIAPDDSIASTL